MEKSSTLVSRMVDRAAEPQHEDRRCIRFIKFSSTAPRSSALLEKVLRSFDGMSALSGK